MEQHGQKSLNKNHHNIPIGRVSKSGRHADARLRKIIHNLRKMMAFERKTVEITSFNLILLILTQICLWFMASPAHLHATFFRPAILTEQ